MGFSRWNSPPFMWGDLMDVTGCGAPEIGCWHHAPFNGLSIYISNYTVYRDSVNDLLKTSQRSNSYYPSMTHCGIIFVPKSTAISLTTIIAFRPLCDAALCSTTARGSSWKKLRQKSQIHTVIFHKTFQSWTHGDPRLSSQNLSCLMGKAMGFDVLIYPNFQNHPLVGW